MNNIFVGFIFGVIFIVFVMPIMQQIAQVIVNGMECFNAKAQRYVSKLNVEISKSQVDAQNYMDSNSYDDCDDGECKIPMGFQIPQADE